MSTALLFGAGAPPALGAGRATVGVFFVRLGQVQLVFTRRGRVGVQVLDAEEGQGEEGILRPAEGQVLQDHEHHGGGGVQRRKVIR